MIRRKASEEYQLGVSRMREEFLKNGDEEGNKELEEKENVKTIKRSGEKKHY